MNWLQNTLSYLSFTSVICVLHLSQGTCSLELVISLIWLVPRNILTHNPSYQHILASARAPQSQPWQYPWSEIGSQQGWSCWLFQCIESICTKMQPFLLRKAREQLRYDGGIEPSCAWSWFFSIPCQPSCSAVRWGCKFLDFGLKKHKNQNASYISITYVLSSVAENWSSSPLESSSLTFSAALLKNQEMKSSYSKKSNDALEFPSLLDISVFNLLMMRKSRC